MDSSSIHSASASITLTVDQLMLCGVSRETADVYVPVLNSRLTQADITTNLRLAHFLAQLIAESNFKPRSEDLGRYTAKNLVQTWRQFRLQDTYDPHVANSQHIFKAFPYKKGATLKPNHLAYADQFVTNAKKNGGNYAQALGNRVYADRNGNGNEQSGDGYNFRGRGLIQITGRKNYHALSVYAHIDYETNPDLVNEPVGAVVSALWFWKVNSLNKYADADKIYPISGTVNRGNPKAEAHGMDSRIKALIRCKKALGIVAKPANHSKLKP